MKWPLLGLILLLAAAVRIYDLSAMGFWTDEFCSLSEANGWGLQLDRIPLDQPMPPLPVCTRLASAKPMSAVIPGVGREDAHPPLYFVMLRVWMNYFGDSEAAVRSLNVVLSVIGVALLFFAVAESLGTAAAVRAALISAVAVSAVQFSQEARNYVIAVTMTAATAWAAVRLGRRPTKTAAAVLSAALFVLMMTHYYAAAAAAAVVLHGLVSFPGPAKRLTIVAAAVAAAVFLVSWGPSFYGQLQHAHGYSLWLADDGPGHLGRLLTRTCALPIRYVVDTRTFGLPAAVLTIDGGLVLLGLPVLYVRRPDLRIWVLLAAAPIAEVAAADLFNHTGSVLWLRYTLIASPAFFVLIAATIRRPRWASIPTAIAVIAGIVSLGTAYVPPWKPDYRTPVEAVGRRLAADDALIVAGPDPILASITFAAFQHYLPRMPDTSAVLTRPASAELTSALGSRRVWVIWMWSNRSIRADLPGFIPEDVVQIPGFGEVTVGHVPTGRTSTRESRSSIAGND